MTLTTAEAATSLHTTTHTIAAWCRAGRLAAVKHGRRWAIRSSAIARLACPTTDRPRTGEHAPTLTGRAGRRQAARRLARATSGHYRIPVIGQHQRARIAMANSGHTVVRDFLFDLGMDIDDLIDYESAAGRKVAEVYRKTHHAEPDNRGLVVLHGRLWHVMRYLHMADLEAGLRAYARTAHLFTDVALAA